LESLKKVIIFIPAWNEEETIALAIDSVRKLYAIEVTRSKGYRVEIFIVDDGSTDKTLEIVLSKGVEVISHPKNLGLGAATRTAMEMVYEMGADIGVKLDADLQHDPEDIERVITPILKNKADICWGSRFAGKIHYKMPFVRYVGNKFFTWLMNCLTDYSITDAQTGLMAFSRKYLAIFEIHGSYNPPQQLLIDAHFKHMRYSEVPAVFHPRKTGKSFVSFRYPFYVLVNILRILVYANPLKVFSFVGLGFILFSVFHLVLSVMNEAYDWNLKIFFGSLSVVTVILGMQALFFGILADLIIKKRKW
jgi:glycosyltransferase involved in cell wall biosynthesis